MSLAPIHLPWFCVSFWYSSQSRRADPALCLPSWNPHSLRLNVIEMLTSAEDMPKICQRHDNISIHKTSLLIGEGQVQGKVPIQAPPLEVWLKQKESGLLWTAQRRHSWLISRERNSLPESQATGKEMLCDMYMSFV